MKIILAIFLVWLAFNLWLFVYLGVARSLRLSQRIRANFKTSIGL